MNYRIINTEDNDSIIRIEDRTIKILNEQEAIDLFMSIAYKTGINNFIIDKENLDESFFDLKNKTAGNILQKIINYRMKLAIIGDYSCYSSNALKSFIYESNKGNDIYFVDNDETAIKMLNRK